MKNNKYVFDTSFISALINDKDVNHQTAVRMLDSLESNYWLIVPRTVELELVMLTNRLAPDFEMQAWFSELSAVFKSIDGKFMEGFRQFVKESKLQLKPMDASILFTTLNENAVLLTFDYKLEALYARMAGQN